MEYLASAVIVITFNPCIVPSPTTNTSFFLLSICSDEISSTPKTTTFFPQSKSEFYSHSLFLYPDFGWG